MCPPFDAILGGSNSLQLRSGFPAIDSPRELSYKRSLWGFAHELGPPNGGRSLLESGGSSTALPARPCRWWVESDAPRSAYRRAQGRAPGARPAFEAERRKGTMSPETKAAR